MNFVSLFSCRNRYDIYYDDICASYDLLKDAFESRQGNLTNHDVDVAFLCAAMKGNIKGVKLLLDNGADIKAVDGNLDNVILLAASYAQIEVVMLLFQRGVPQNEANVYHYTPVVEACYLKTWILMSFYWVKLILKVATRPYLQDVKKKIEIYK